MKAHEKVWVNPKTTKRAICYTIISELTRSFPQASNWQCVVTSAKMISDGV